MNAQADFRHDTIDGGEALRFSGRLSLSCLGDFPERLRSFEGKVDLLDLSGIDRIDTVGAWLIHRFAAEHESRIEGLSPEAAHLMAQVAAADRDMAMRPPPSNFLIKLVGEVGQASISAVTTLAGLLGFFGATVLAFLTVLRHPRRFRLNATVRRFEVVGISALGIIGLMSFLIGLVIAQQGSVQLRQFGAEIFTINLIGRITLRELGVLMTAIMVAGRSGSAFAAQIGTMKLTEEIDAMRTIGVSPMEALVLPRVIAAVLMMPLLGFYSSVVAIIGGGLLCWAALDIPPVTFIQRLREVVPTTDVYVGLLKAPVFGLIIAVTGCFQGMQVESDAEQVGQRTTSAVVQAIFLVIVLDAFFAVFFTWIGWI
ncbi:ABC transporter permease [Sphingomonas sp.]|uniref:ABC transporter permease n=1 Tax=Sphingomonas sp. TaxID=28214 RepID=UPI001DEF5F33|nr:ABC transporter permease [Sphingomonas sp.]MBX9797413.1 ABC transporter permease [Sphingomonas sp.]